ncbi:MAG: lipoate--protein ligase family protein [Acidimicrobiales bacterium]
MPETTSPVREAPAGSRAGCLRVVDFGNVPAVSSQALWHSIATGVSRGAPPTLSFMRPESAYVSLGYHTSVAALDMEQCRRRSLPVLRRLVGGGAVYIDDAQLFFQICLPAAAVPAQRSVAVRRLLEPAAAAFRSAGLEVELDCYDELSAGRRKACGHGAGQIEEAAAVVGNVIEGFDHEAASSVMAVPSAAEARELERLMREYVGPPANPGGTWRVDPAAFKEAAAGAYARTLGLVALPVEPACLGPDDLPELDYFEALLSDPGFVGEQRPQRGGPWVAKVRGGVGVLRVECAGGDMTLSVVDGKVTRARIFIEAGNGMSSDLPGAMEGLSLEEAGRLLAASGPAGAALAAVLGQAGAGRFGDARPGTQASPGSTWERPEAVSDGARHREEQLQA